MKDFLQISKERYTTKHYDATKKISDKDFETLLEFLRLAPSAVNVQPWVFYVGNSQEAKDKLLPAIPDFNIPRVQESSAYVLICTKTDITDTEFKAITAKEDADGRYGTRTDIRDTVDEHRKAFAHMHMDMGDFVQWGAKQCYLAMASILYGAQSLGIDSTPIEGMDFAKADEIFNLKAQNLTSVAIVTLGKRAVDDSNAKRPKSRLDKKDIIREV